MNKLKKLITRYEWKNYVIYYGMWAVLIAFLVWCVASYFNILAHNTTGDCTYHYWKYNALIIMFNFWKAILGK